MKLNDYLEQLIEARVKKLEDIDDNEVQINLVEYFINETPKHRIPFIEAFDTDRELVHQVIDAWKTFDENDRAEKAALLVDKLADYLIKACMPMLIDEFNNLKHEKLIESSRNANQDAEGEDYVHYERRYFPKEFTNDEEN
jgi:hypothetical protein